MPPIPASGPHLTRRGLLASSAAAGLVLFVSGCTSSADQQNAVTDDQADALSAQVTVQEGLVAAYRAAIAAAPALAAAAGVPSTQASAQLTRLRAAAPGSSSSGRASSSGGSAASSTPPGPPAGQDPAAWLVAQITAAADSHAAACAGQKGARAALLGSIAAGLRGQAAVLR